MLSHLVSNIPRRAIPSARRAISVQVAAAPSRARSRALTVSAVRAQSILHGSKEAKEVDDHEHQHHSRLVGRGKYLHGIESALHAHEKRLSRCPQPYCLQFIASSRTVSRSTRRPRKSSFSVVVWTRGVVHRACSLESVITPACGTMRDFGSNSQVILKVSSGNKIHFVRLSRFPSRACCLPSLDHILEYENHSGFDDAWKKIPGSAVRCAYTKESSIQSCSSLLFSTRKPMTPLDLFFNLGPHSSRKNSLSCRLLRPMWKAASLSYARTS
jgi:hypothetical protein